MEKSKEGTGGFVKALGPPPPARPELDELVRRAIDAFNALPPEQQDEMLRKQREGYVRAEMSWPRDCPYR